MASLVLADYADELFTFLPAVTIDAVRADLDLSLAEAGALLAFLPAGGLLGNFFTLAADFVSRRGLAAAGAAAYGAAMVGFGAGRSFVVLAVCAFVWGAASDAFVHGTGLALADLAGDDLEPTLATVNILGSLGAVMAPIAISVAEATGLGWRAVLVGGGASMLAYAAWLAVQPVPPPARPEHSPWTGVVSVVRDSAVRRLSLVNVCLTALDFAFLGFLSLFLVEQRGFSRAGAAGILAVLLGGSFAAYAVLAATHRSLSRTAAFVAGSTAFLAVIPVLLLTSSRPLIVVGAFVLGAAIAVWWVVLQAEMLRVRPGQTGTTYAVIATLSLPELAIAPLMGAAADRFGLGAALALFLVLPGLTLGTVLLPRLRPWAKASRSRSLR